MLARIANSLYWTGRYLERSEHLARYLGVQYFSMLDAPMSQSRDFTLTSIINMYGLSDVQTGELKETDVLRSAAMDYDSPLSIRSTVQLARENARVARHVISTELWEAINGFHLNMQRVDPEFFLTHGLHDFTTDVGRNCAIVRARIDDTLLHDETWIFIKLGIHIERVIQVMRILDSKLHDIDLMTDRGENRALRQYQGTVILKIVEGFDMHKKLYQHLLTPKTTIDFLVGHPNFARSLTYNMKAVTDLLKRMEASESRKPNKLLFKSGKIFSGFRYLEYEDVKSDIGGYLNDSLTEVYALHDAIVANYFGEE
ncbi:alpha-E domain-containing protein [Neolewinella antarctica]|uniref:Alpha-E superfamily protein n=1 Tax=Neolewinella antarctica TaxID=442734 RepID=A0ABX0XFI5_9BACT|nr:alpha-E domain-containing protein [Neolewinella antarctica]NJC27651.1 putative alpha-E superfamily protein [Neolewinella antarctica]